MRPETFHLALTVFRHFRGIINAVEKFSRTVPFDEQAYEIGQIVDFAREAIGSAESTLAAAMIAPAEVKETTSERA